MGKIDNLKNRLNFEGLPGNIGIGHTRWATHGTVSFENAHPHADCTKKIAIIHNGIIENSYQLREALLERGHEFAGDTDSEVIAHLIEDRLNEAPDWSVAGDGEFGMGSSDNGSFVTACLDAFRLLRGSYAILAIKEGEDKIVGIRKDSPLVLGLADHGTFFASDVSPFLEWTKKVVYLQNYDFVVADGKGVKFYNLLQGEVSRPVDTVEWSMEEASRGKFEHFMLKEISEQADTIQRALRQDGDVIKRIVDEVRKGALVSSL